MNNNLQQRISAFVQLGKALQALSTSESWPGFECGLTESEFTDFRTVINTNFHYNGWFTKESVEMALRSWAEALQEENLNQWIAPYAAQIAASTPQRVAIICAGNIPMVGFHDILCTLITGNFALIKPSSDDARLIPGILFLLVKWYEPFSQQFEFAQGKLEKFDRVIATGSNNTSRYFHQYFAAFPHIIRKSRTSIAVLTGKESKEEMKLLGHDVFDHFGLGCRNVTKIYVPKGYDLNHFFEGVYDFHPIVNHNKYANNYDYIKAIWMLNQEDLLENGFLILKQDDALKAPTGSLYYSYYESEEELNKLLEEKKEEIQCIVGLGHIPFGQAQCPKLTDYADGVNTLDFLVGDAINP